MELWYPNIPHDPGADCTAQLNAARADAHPEQGLIVHRTIGRWPGDYGVGKGRRHSTPGTFPVLIGQGYGEWVEFYPLNTRCTHAADANRWPGIEFSGMNGEPLTEWQILAGGHVVAFLFSLGMPRNFYNGFLGLVKIDGGTYRGTCTHSAVLTSPQWQHHNFITPAEFVRIVAVADSINAPAPVPAPVDPIDWNAVRRALIGITIEEVKAGPVLGIFARNDEVRSWQNALNLVSGGGFFESTPVTSVFDARTIERTRGWQAFLGLPPDGVVEQQDRDVMAYNLSRLAA